MVTPGPIHFFTKNVRGGVISESNVCNVIHQFIYVRPLHLHFWGRFTNLPFAFFW